MIGQLLLWLWLVGLSIITAWAYWLVPDSSVASNWQGLVYVLAPLTAVITGVIAVRQFSMRSPQGRALAMLVLGVAAWCVGELLWTYYDLIAHIDPYPSLADVFYLVAYLPLAAGLILEIKFLRSQVTTQKASMQHFLLGVIALLLMGVGTYFGVYKAYNPAVNVLENVVAISYGLADVALVMFSLSIAVVAVEMRGGKLARPWWWLLVGFICIFVADIAFAMFNTQYELQQGHYKSVLDSLWILGYLAIAYGFHHYAWLIQSVQQYLEDAAGRMPRGNALEQTKPVQRQRNSHRR